MTSAITAGTRLSLFALPTQLLSQLTSEAPVSVVTEPLVSSLVEADSDGRGFSCGTCGVSVFESVEQQRAHFRSLWHSTNVKRRLLKKDTLGEQDFEQQQLDHNSSTNNENSESENESDEDGSEEQGAEQAPVDDDSHDLLAQNQGSPFVAFALKDWPTLAVFVLKQVLFNKKDAMTVSLKDELVRLQHPQPTPSQTPKWTLIMFSAGHFAAAVFEASAPTVYKNNTSSPPVVIEHKTFHRYTTRRKQGGAQSANDNSKGKANSAGSNLRRHNEMMLQQDIQNLLEQWAPHIQSSSRIFIRCPPRNARKTVFFNEQLLSSTDPRVRGYPFITNRPTITELTRAFTELSTVYIREYSPPQPKETLSGAPNSPATQLKSLSVSASESNGQQQQQQQQQQRQPEEPFPKLLDFCKRNKFDLFRKEVESKHASTEIPTLINTTLDYTHGTTLLHVSSASGSHEIVAYLLSVGADPTIREAEGKGRPAYALAETKEVRDAFRRAYAEDLELHKEPRFDWVGGALVPSPLTKELEAQQKEKEREKKKKQKQKQKESLEQRNKELAEAAAAREVVEAKKRAEEEEKAERAKKANVFSKLAKSEREAIGMTPERRMQLDREKRALAAEARFRAQQGKCSNCAKLLTPAATFEKFQYKYCSTDCVKNQLVLHN
ncbi:hypothetical protein BDR26DRAFT_869462 [Obelidium mucronatum]|nr:hypothetical protein BDR26DRAFT_869462 [Obelidium mucronatum]